MRACSAGALLVLLGLQAACGGKGPSSPSPFMPSAPLAPSTSTTQGIVTAAVNQAAVNQAAMNTAMTVSADGLTRTVTIPCAEGGSMSMTFTSTSTGSVPSGTFTSSSRLEITDCRVQTVTINGDPSILMEGTYTFGPATGGIPSSMTATTRMTGGLRFDTAGSSGRARYDCTMIISMQIGTNGTPGQPTITSSGTITWEQPIGTVAVRSCGA